MYSRRDFGKLALIGLPFSLSLAEINSKVNGVRIGVQSYSFRSLSLDDAIKAMVEIGIGECELFSGHVEPRPQFGLGGARPLQAGAQAGAQPGVAPTGAQPQQSAGAMHGPPAGGSRGPNPAAREELRKWRLATPLEHFKAIRKKFDKAGITLQGYNLSIIYRALNQS